MYITKLPAIPTQGKIEFRRSFKLLVFLKSFLSIFENQQTDAFLNSTLETLDECVNNVNNKDTRTTLTAL